MWLSVVLSLSPFFGNQFLQHLSKPERTTSESATLFLLVARSHEVEIQAVTTYRARSARNNQTDFASGFTSHGSYTD
jgi:hypothetical protein